MLAELATSVAVDDGTMAVTLEPVLDLISFENQAEIFGTPVGFNDDEG
ncbi:MULTISPECIES: hypothetical protein [Mycolicibacterium]|jgi:hypothetical protein|uniref:Uncharacterized protein n=1 Tax=Mycolicibacterium farcinogenes TaxID=1802 RepID=A0ACD1FJS9_MYCFR|nr:MULTISPECIES: hypothetical protein [Mycolicibacterium]QZH67302.1 hypothetical protein K6L26_06495 [Mycolicibacterium farcinogenes]